MVQQKKNLEKKKKKSTDFHGWTAMGVGGDAECFCSLQISTALK